MVKENLSPRQLFKQCYGDSHNFMTPNIIKYGKKGHFYYELSKGRGISFNYNEKEKMLYGVTILTQPQPGVPNKEHRLSTVFRDQETCIEYVKWLKDNTLVVFRNKDNDDVELREVFLKEKEVRDLKTNNIVHATVYKYDQGLEAKTKANVNHTFKAKSEDEAQEKAIDHFTRQYSSPQITDIHVKVDIVKEI